MSLGKKVFSAAAAMFLAGTAGAFYWRTLNPESESFIHKKILTPDSYKEITSAIRSRFSSKYWPELKAYRTERRRCHPDSAEYQTSVLNFQKTIKRMVEESTNEILKEFRVNKDVFEESVNFYDSDLELKEYGESLIKPINPVLPPTKLSMNDTNTILQYYSNNLKDKNSDIIDFDEYLVITSQIEDEIYRNYRIEIEEVTNAFEKYKDHLEDVVESMKMQTSSILASTDNSF
ncbi:hypothetical protein SteCoe_12823 [Stentor coeruleus]|uniref:Uncharacterized protein n=1 Tax=Stentor coeruleus TaxID=5963 RepID=A0A1R2C9S5_9CILI|nr:hypothetical protein SteCoe_12823 [Stentor coeruleus]